jgi:hypothetical protein
MMNSQWGFPSAVLGALSALALGCSSDGSTGADASNAMRDADPADPDADPTAPDANPAAIDAAPGAPDASTVTGCSAEAVQLITLVNEYRAENALPAIPASPSLCFVGDAHVDDLVDNSPHATGSCNLHSWSDQGSWSACCYTPDHAQAQCMWDKPGELTAYPSNGYENAASGSSTPAQALNQWKNSSGHRAVILNEGIWANQSWKAVGVGMRNGYAVLWFGTAVDPAN